MKYIKNWDEIKDRFTAWWEGTGMDRPLMRVAAWKEDRKEINMKKPRFDNFRDEFTSVEKRIYDAVYYCKTHTFYGEAFPYVEMHLGPGSMALYLGCQPVFDGNTIWYNSIAGENLDDIGKLEYNEDSYWLKKHKDMYREAKKNSYSDLPLSIPDIVESLDILASVRGAQNLCVDIADKPNTVKKYLRQIEDLYFKYYDDFYKLAQIKDGGSVYSYFQVWGPGKMAKLQCDFSSMISEGHFRDMVIPTLRRQCREMDSTIYHLDGVDAVRHLDAVLEIEELDVIQWVPGIGKPDCGSPQWYYIYDKAVSAGKSLWLYYEKGSLREWIDKTKRLVKRYGNDRLYIYYPDMKQEEAAALFTAAAKNWQV